MYLNPAVLDTLKDCALHGKLFREEAKDLVASYAALALGRVGTADYIGSMLQAIKTKSIGLNVTFRTCRRSASLRAIVIASSEMS